MNITIKVVQTLFLSLIYILLYWKSDDNYRLPIAVNNRLGAIFFVVINVFILYFNSVLVIFPSEKETFLKEYNSGLYSIVPYYFSKVMIELPLLAFFPFSMIMIVYFPTNFDHEVSKYFFMGLYAAFLSVIGSLMGILLGCLFSDAKMAIEIAPMIFIPFILFSGFNQNSDNIWVGFKWIEYISPIRYFFELFVRNEFEDRN